MTVKQCKLDALIERMWRQAEAKGYAELNPDDVISLAELKAERDSLRGKMELINGLIGVSEMANTLAEQRLDELNKQVVNLAVENAEMKSKARELIDEASLVYRKYNDTQMPDRDLVDGQTLQEMHDACQKTPDTDTAIANCQAQGVNKAISKLEASKFGDEGDLIVLRKFAAELRKGASV